MSQAIMRFHKCDIGYEDVRIRALNLQVNKGDFVSVVGPTGVGKTTLIRLISGVDKKGRQPRQLAGVWERPDSISRGIVFQSTDQLLPWKTALENVLLPSLSQDAALLGMTRNEFKERAKTLLDMVGLISHKDKYPADLSGGMRQRVAIARAMLLKPELLLMDEPFGSLDAITRSRLQSILKKIHQSTETTILFVTHDVDEAVCLSNKILVLNPWGQCQVIDNILPLTKLKIKEEILKTLQA